VCVPESDPPRLVAAEPLSEMHRRVLGTDWAATPAGPLEEWSPTLRTAASVCLASRVAMLLMIGPELVMLYNDGYAAMLGRRHPGALRQRMAEVWPVVGPLAQRGLAGEATFDEDLPLLMSRNGFAIRASSACRRAHSAMWRSTPPSSCR
jgi:hypothetical protein